MACRPVGLCGGQPPGTASLFADSGRDVFCTCCARFLYDGQAHSVLGDPGVASPTGVFVAGLVLEVHGVWHSYGTAWHAGGYSALCNGHLCSGADRVRRAGCPGGQRADRSVSCRIYAQHHGAFGHGGRSLHLVGFVAYLRGNSWRSACLFSAAALSKETAVIAPAALLVCEAAIAWHARGPGSLSSAWRGWLKRVGPLLLPALLLAIWFVILARACGNPFGDADYVHDNLGGGLDPLHVAQKAVRHRVIAGQSFFISARRESRVPGLRQAAPGVRRISSKKRLCPG